MATPKPEQDGGGRESNRRRWAKAMNLSVIGTVFPVALMLGYFAGRWVGGFFEATALGGLVGTLVGVAAGFYNVVKMVGGLDPKRDRPAPTNGDARAPDDSGHEL